MENNIPKYKATCPSCSTEMYVSKSIGQEMGVNDLGGGWCIECSSRLNFTFNPDQEKMIAMEWDKWAESKEATT